MVERTPELRMHELRCKGLALSATVRQVLRALRECARFRGSAEVHLGNRGGAGFALRRAERESVSRLLRKSATWRHIACAMYSARFTLGGERPDA